MNPPSKNPAPPPHLIIRVIDRAVVWIVKALILLAELRSRDASRGLGRLLAPDHREQSRMRTWQAMLDWPPQRRVGCFTGVLIGLAIGGAILWYGLK